MRLINKYFRLTIELLPSKAVKKMKLIVLGFTLLSIFDFVGVILLGSVGTIAYRVISGDSKPSRIEIIINDLLPINLSIFTLAFFLTVIAISFLAFKTILTAFFNFRLISFLSRQESNLSTELFNQVLNSKYRESIKNSLSNYQWAIMTGSNRYISGVLVTLLNFISDTFSAGLLLILAIYASPVATIVVAILLSLSYLLFSKFMHKKASILGKSITSMHITLNNLIINAIKGKKEIYVYNIENKFSEDFSKFRLKLAKESQISQWLNSLFRYYMELSLLFVGIITILIQISITDIRHAVTVIVVYMMIGFRLIPSVQRIQSTIISLRISEPMIETFLKYKDSLEADNKINKKHHLNKIDLVGVKIENLEYINENSSKIVINKLNLEIKPGELFAILGESGAGKTTLIDLICDIEQPTRGAIKFIDNLGNITMRPEMAYVPQSPFIVAGDIYHNIAFGSESIKKQEINNLINILNLDIVAQRLNEINFEGIFEEGNNLSGGEKQRIGIARAIYSRKNFIVLDEPTSALDIENQARIINLLKGLKNKKTIVVVTHNSGLATLADRHIILPSNSN